MAVRKGLSLSGDAFNADSAKFNSWHGQGGKKKFPSGRAAVCRVSNTKQDGSRVVLGIRQLTIFRNNCHFEPPTDFPRPSSFDSLFLLQQQ